MHTRTKPYIREVGISSRARLGRSKSDGRQCLHTSCLPQESTARRSVSKPGGCNMKRDSYRDMCRSMVIASPPQSHPHCLRLAQSHTPCKYHSLRYHKQRLRMTNAAGTHNKHKAPRPFIRAAMPTQ